MVPAPVRFIDAGRGNRIAQATSRPAAVVRHRRMASRLRPTAQHRQRVRPARVPGCIRGHRTGIGIRHDGPDALSEKSAREGRGRTSASAVRFGMKREKAPCKVLFLVVKESRDCPSLAICTRNRTRALIFLAVIAFCIKR